MLDIPLIDKRDLIRYKADFSDHFICSQRKVLEGVWLNIEQLRDMGQEERFQFIIDLFHMLELDE